jgi:hypothetical protein
MPQRQNCEWIDAVISKDKPKTGASHAMCKQLDIKAFDL